MKGYIKIRNKAIEVLNSELATDLYYHGAHHTMDVLKVANNYIKREKIDRYSSKLLRIAVLFHDIGFSVSNIDHEERGVEIAKKYMTENDFSQHDFEIVKGLIMATRIPQTPKNYLEKIICDADLDYLGRKDFYPISNELFRELQAFSIVNDEKKWNKIQIEFLETHHYHTEFAKKNRQPKKEERIKELKKLVKK